MLVWLGRYLRILLVAWLAGGFGLGLAGAANPEVKHFLVALAVAAR